MTALMPRPPTPTPRPPTRRPPGPRPGAGRGPAGPAGRRPAPSRPHDELGGAADPLQRLTVGFVHAFLEVECGRRTRAQLQPVLCPRLADRLAPVWVRESTPGHLLHTYGARVAPDRYEAVALVRRGRRVGALVVALAHTAAGWRVVDAARPEDGLAVAGPPAAADAVTEQPWA